MEVVDDVLVRPATKPVKGLDDFNLTDGEVRMERWQSLIISKVMHGLLFGIEVPHDLTEGINRS